MLVLLLGVACTAVPDPTPTPVQNVAEVATLVVERPSATLLLTLTPTPQSTITPEAANTNTPSPTPEATAVPTATPAPSSTPFTDDDPLWQENVQAAYVETGWVEWSPVANEFVFDTCGDIYSELDLNGDIFIATAPLFEPYKISPTEAICNYLAMSDTIWTPDGQKLFFGGPLPEPEPHLSEYAQVWVMDRDSQNAHPIAEVRDWWLGFSGWMDENTLVYNGRAGHGLLHIDLLDISSGESLGWAVIDSGDVYHIDANYIGTQNGSTDLSYMRAAAISKIAQDIAELEISAMYGLHLYTLSHGLNSRYEDWLTGTNNMLVLTWAKDAELGSVDLLHDSAVTQLRLWNVETDELVLLISEAVKGQFSPNGRFLAYVTPGIPTPSIHLLPEMGSGPILSLPLAAKRVGESNAYNFYFSFAPNGRYFTFLTPGTVQLDGEGKPIGVDYQPENIHVNLFDMDTQQLIVSLPAQEFVPVWSPDNGRFLYQDEFGTLSLYDLVDNTAFPLTQNPDARLTNPHWSFDGSYLSVTVRGGIVVKTAVLSVLQ